jgi:hypothetical protein
LLDGDATRVRDDGGAMPRLLVTLLLLTSLSACSRTGATPTAVPISLSPAPAAASSTVTFAGDDAVLHVRVADTRSIGSPGQGQYPQPTSHTSAIRKFHNLSPAAIESSDRFSLIFRLPWTYPYLIALRIAANTHLFVEGSCPTIATVRTPFASGPSRGMDPP